MSRYFPSVMLDIPLSLPKEAQEINSPDPDWFKDFQNNLKMTQANPFDSLHEQIYSIMNGNSKSKFSSVQEMVEDLQERTGLKSFLEQKKAEEFLSLVQKSASVKEFSSVPQMKTFIDNYIEDRPGTTIDSVIYNLLKINDIAEKLDESNDVSDDVKRYINDKIMEGKSHSGTATEVVNSHLGKVDVSDSNDDDDDHDPLAFCEPSNASSLKFKFIK